MPVYFRMPRGPPAGADAVSCGTVQLPGARTPRTPRTTPSDTSADPGHTAHYLRYGRSVYGSSVRDLVARGRVPSSSWFLRHSRRVGLGPATPAVLVFGRFGVRSAITFRAKFREIPRKWPFGQHEPRKFRAKFHEITWNPRSVSRAYFPRWRPPWKKFGECIIVHLKDYCRFPF